MSNSSYNQQPLTEAFLSKAAPTASPEPGVGYSTGWFPDRASLGEGAYVLTPPPPPDERFSLRPSTLLYRRSGGAQLGKPLLPVCAGSAGAGIGSRRGPRRPSRWVGSTEEFRPPCAATPPRLALSGALMLNAGYEYRQLPAAPWTDCTTAAPLGAERRISKDGKASSSEGSAEKTLSWISTGAMFRKSFPFPF